jgi:hypothetical protein
MPLLPAVAVLAGSSYLCMGALLLRSPGLVWLVELARWLWVLCSLATVVLMGGVGLLIALRARPGKRLAVFGDPGSPTRLFPVVYSASGAIQAGALLAHRVDAAVLTAFGAMALYALITAGFLRAAVPLVRALGDAAIVLAFFSGSFTGWLLAVLFRLVGPWLVVPPLHAVIVAKPAPLDYYGAQRERSAGAGP